jgi:hypothetical protein
MLLIIALIGQNLQDLFWPLSCLRPPGLWPEEKTGQIQLPAAIFTIFEVAARQCRAAFYQLP